MERGGPCGRSGISGGYIAFTSGPCHRLGNQAHGGATSYAEAFATCVDLTVARIGEASTAAAAAAAAAANGENDENGKHMTAKQEEEEELEVSRKAKADQVPGLAASLEMLVSKATGGCRASEKARGITSLREGLTRLCGAIKNSGSKSADVRRLSKDLQALLEDGVKKTD